MTARKKKPKDMDSTILGFNEALDRLIITGTKELAGVRARVVKDAEEIERDAKEHFKDIKSGGRNFKRPFRP
jgi:hypothetical protein